MDRPHWPPRWRITTAALVMLILMGCEATEPGLPDGPEIPQAGLRLEALSDTNLTGTVGSRVGSAPVVRLTMADSSPAPGREVQFLVSRGGTIEVSSQRTDTAGRASPGIWTLGTAAGTQTLVARSAGVSDVRFTALAAAGAPASIQLVAGNHQTAGVGEDLATPLQVKLTDRYDNPIPGAPVGFSVLVGAGTIGGPAAVTDSHGIATAGPWTLGAAGAQLVRASGVGVSALAEAFACEVPCRGRDLLYVRNGTLFLLANGTVTAIHDDAASAAWSPDGQRIVVVNYVGLDHDPELMLMDADGSNATLLARGYDLPSWSPDGARLALAGPSGVYVLHVLGGSEPVLLAESASAPAWSPDGTRIAFSTFSPDGFSINVMNADGSSATSLVSSSESHLHHPAWSPDGQRIAFTRCMSGACGIFAMNADGGDAVQLSPLLDAYNAAWSPEGSRIAFSSRGGIYWVPAGGGLSEPVLLVSEGYSPAWRP